MKPSRSSFVVITILTIVLGLLAIPRLSIPVGDSELVLPGLDLSVFGVNSFLGNFRRGNGIYSDLVVGVTAEYEGSNTFAEDLSIIRRRMDVAGLNAITLTQFNGAEGPSVAYEFPDYYGAEQSLLIAALLSSPGTVQILKDNQELPETSKNPTLSELFDDYRAEIADLSIEDFTNITLDIVEGLDTRVIGLQPKEGTRQKFIAEQGSNPYAVAVDGIPRFYIVDVSGSGNSMVAVPIDGTTASTMGIQASYLRGDGILSGRFSLDDSVETIAPLYALEGRVFLSVSLMASAIVLAFAAGYRRTWQEAIKFTLALSFFIFLSLVLLKLAAAVISIGTVLAFAVMYAIAVVVIYQALSSSNRERLLRVYRDMAGLLFIVAALVFTLGIPFALIQDMVATIALMAIALYLGAGYAFSLIINYRG